MPNKEFTVDVLSTPSTYHPERVKVTITPKRAAEIRKMAAIVKENQALAMWSIHAWDNSPEWSYMNGTVERMDVCHIIVTDHGFSYGAQIKHCDVECESESIPLEDLPEEE